VALKKASKIIKSNGFLMENLNYGFISIGDYLRKNFTDSPKHTIEDYLPEIINNII
jgi:hypothetical protein